MASTGEVRHRPLNLTRPGDTVHLGGLPVGTHSNHRPGGLSLCILMSSETTQIEGRLGAASLQVWGSSASPARHLCPVPVLRDSQRACRLLPGDLVHDAPQAWFSSRPATAEGRSSFRHAGSSGACRESLESTGSSAPKHQDLAPAT